MPDYELKPTASDYRLSSDYQSTNNKIITNRFIEVKSMKVLKITAAIGAGVSFVIIAGGLLYSGCQNNLVQPKGDRFLSSSYGGSSTNDLVGVLLVYQIKHSGLDTLNTPTTTYQRSANASFSDSLNEFPVNAGVVTFNNNTFNIVDGLLWYQLEEPQFSLNGGMNHFYIGGSAHFPALTDSVSSPVDETSISSPSLGDTISRSSGFTIYWNTGSADTVDISVIALDGSDSSAAHGLLVPNTGSYTVSSSVMNGWPLGRLLVTVKRANFVRRTIPGTSRDVLYVVYSAHIIWDLTLKN